MKKLAFAILFLFLTGLVIYELVSSRDATAEPEASGYKFYYYPKLNVYYDATQNNFVYTVDGGITWQTKKPANADLPEKLSEKVAFYSPDPAVWIYNSEHRRKFKGVATNYIQRVEDSAQFVAPPTSPAVDSSLLAQNKEAQNQKTEAGKKKNGSWFNRLKDKIKRGFKKNKEQASDTI